MERSSDSRSVAEKLDSVNANLRGRRKRSEVIRRRLESQLESKSRRARSREQPASTGYKRVPTA